MAAYDNIADAFALLPGGAATGLTNVGATYETNDDTNGPQNECVWMKVDLSDYITNAIVDVDIAVSGVTGGAGFHPYIDVMKVADATFDPTAPDFSKLDWLSAGFPYLGDGTTSPPAKTLPLRGGTGSISGDRSMTGVYYLFFTDWDYDGTEGSATFSYTVPEAPLCINAVDVINPAAASRFDGSAATVVGSGTRVRETWSAYQDFGGVPSSYPDWTLKWTWAGDTGMYKVSISGQSAAAGSLGSPRSVFALFRVNGKMVTTQKLSGTASAVAAPFNWYGFDGWVDGVYNYADLHDYGWLPLTTGDEIEVMIISVMVDGSFVFIPFEVDQVCFEVDPAAPASSDCTPTWDFGDPVGDAWGSPNNWGGQRLVPDQIWTHLGITAYDEAEFPWGINYTDYDFCAMEDGSLYVIIKDAYAHGLSYGPTNPDRKIGEYQFVVIKKYDPGSDSWSQLGTLNIHTPTQAYRADGVSCELGADGKVYFSWWEADTYNYTGVAGRELWKWHVVKLDPADDSYAELGTGQHAFDPSTAGFTINYTFDTLASTILPMADGTVYVATIEDTGTNANPSSPGQGHHLVVWKWNGSSWTNLSLPAPTDLGNASWWQVNGENQFWDRPSTMVAARSGGPVTDGFTLVYPYTFHDNTPFSNNYRQGVTISYTEGVGWHDEIISDWSTLLYAEQQNYPAPPALWTPRQLVAFDADILWSENLGKLVFVADHVGGGAGESWVMYQLNDAGTQWEPIETAPPAVAGAWRQSRNSADIGPDGEVYRAMMSEWNTDGNFNPRIVKHSPGYGVGWANAVRSEPGQVTNKDFPWQMWMYATSNFRMRIVGNVAYVMMCVYAESTGYHFGEDESADAIYILKATYVPCGAGPVSMNWREAQRGGRAL